jgi:hypothetical protein
LTRFSIPTEKSLARKRRKYGRKLKIMSYTSFASLKKQNLSFFGQRTCQHLTLTKIMKENKLVNTKYIMQLKVKQQKRAFNLKQKA